jgi:diguanylate cyclase (GGDEF)-like protein
MGMEKLIRIGQSFFQWSNQKNDNQRRLILVLLALSFCLGIVEAGIITTERYKLLMYGFAGLSLISLIMAYRRVLWPGRILTPVAGFTLVTIFIYEQGIHDESIGGYYLLLMVAGLLIGDAGSLLFGALSTFAIVAIGIAEYLNLTPALPTRRLSDPFEIATTAILMLGTTAVLHYIVLQLQHEAENAHTSEQAQLVANNSLRELQAELEKRVELRTAELQAANQEMTQQLEEIRDLRHKLQEEAIRDPLTGLFNRRYLETTLIREFAHARREDYDISFMLLDIDHFKKFNDLYGHSTGDLAIKTVAQQLTSRARAAGIACRMGGEEFLLVMPGILDEVAQLRAEYFRDQVMALPIPYGDKMLNLTVSIGVASFPKNGETWEELYEAVDQALYRAKQNGRNRVECA